MFDVTRKHDSTLHFPERPHSERVAEDVMADLYPAFVFLLLPLCHLLRYRQLGSLARSRDALRCGGCASCLLSVGQHGGAGTILTLLTARNNRRLEPAAAEIEWKC